MKIRGKIKFKEAIYIDENLLKKLEEVILEFFKKVTYECRLCNDDYIEFNSLNELLCYENNKYRKIDTIKIKFDYNVLEFSPTTSILSSYEYNVFGEYEVYDSDKSILFQEKVMNILKCNKKSKWYTFLTKISTFHLWIVIIGFFVANAIFSAIKGGINEGNIFTTNALNLTMAVAIILSIFLALMCNVFAKCRNTLFPPISFMIGEQIQEIRKNEDRFSKIFWGIIVAFIVSFVVAKIV